jgi:hypothetical protein
MENKNLSDQINAARSRAKEQDRNRLDISLFKSQILSQISADLANKDINPSDPPMFLKAPDWPPDRKSEEKYS